MIAIIGGCDADNIKVLNKMLPVNKYTKFYVNCSEENKFKDRQNNYHNLNNLLNNSLIIYDNNNNDENAPVDYFIKKNISCFYLTPTYGEIPKCFRDKLTYVVLFAQDKSNFRQLYVEQIWGGPDFKTFTEICEMHWKVPQGFYSTSINSASGN